ncbi:MAG: ABC transporter substrate-binding protein [Planctomycetes bacterium]|nr:ABC transporter substrate-binding protein [Planctomycetota bacterium]
MTRTIVLMTILAVACLPAGGCGKDDSRGGGPAKGKTVVRFLEGPDNGGGWKEIVSRFEAAHPEIDVELVEGPASTNTREEMYTASFLSGDSTYDVICMDIIWVPKLAAQGWLLPLDDRLPPNEREKFLPGDIQGSIYEGRIYRVPMRSDAGMLYYRSDVVTTPPETFEDLVRLSREHQKPPGMWGFVFQAKQYEGLVCNFLEVLWGHGGDVFDGTGRVILDGPEAVRALTWMCGLVRDVSPEGVTTYQEEESRHVFHEGHALFMRNWPYAWTKAQEEGSPIRGKVGIVPMVHAPGKSSAATLGGWGFGIAKSAKNPDAAWKFISFATAEAQQKTLHLRNGAIPTRRSLFQDPEVLAESPHYPDLYKVLLAARPRPVHPRYPEISDAIQRHVSAALVGREAVEEALKHTAAEIRKIVGR